MPDRIIHKRSLTTGSIPTTSSLPVGEIAINVPDGKMFIHKSGSTSDSIETVLVSNSTTNIGNLTLSGSLILSGSNGSNILDINTDSIIFDFDTLAFVGSSTLTGPLSVTGTTTNVGSLIVTGSTTSTLGFTGSLLGTATTASYVLNAVSSSFASTSSFVNTLSQGVIISGSLNVTNGITGSLLGTSSYATTASYWSGSINNADSASFATTASYALNPLIPTQVSQLANDSGYITSAALSPYQPILVSGTTIKTINGTSLLGAGDITISAAAALSGITAATAAHTINNAAFQQEWQWNSLTNGTGLKLSSNSTLASSNSQSIFEIANSGANATSTQITYGAKISNTKTGTSSTNYGLAITATGATTNLPLLANGVAEIARFDGTTNPYLTFYKNGVLKSYLGQYYSLDDHLRIQTSSTNSIYMGTNNATQVVIENNRLGVNSNPTCPLDVTGTAVGGRIAKFSGGGVEVITTNDAAFFHTRASVFGTFGVNSSGNLIIGCNAGGTGTQIAIHSTRNNVGIGTITPNASAKLDVSSTTQGFAPPEMTATQASAISTTSRKLIIYVTDTNGTFTSAGLWMWNGATWKLILAE